MAKVKGMKRLSGIPFVWWGTAVLLLAALLRLLSLAQLPPGLAQDEVLDADIVTTILEGNHALFFWQGYGHEPLYHYFNVPFRLALGDNWLAIRYPSIVTGLLLIALTMRWVRREWGKSVALTTAAFLALHWWPIIFSRIGIRPISEPVLLVLGAWFWPKRPWLAGLLWGLSLYTYTGARVVLAVPVLVGVIQWFAQRSRGAGEQGSRGNPQSAFRNPHSPFIISALLISLPLFITLALNPELQQRLDQLAGPLEALRAGDVRPVLGTIWATLGAFSWAADPRWTYGHPSAPLFDWLTAALFHLGLAFTLWRWREPRHTFLLVWLAVTLLPSALSPDAPSMVRLVGALPVVFVFPSLALQKFAEGQRGRGAEGKISSAPLLLRSPALPLFILTLTLARTTYWGFAMWPQTAETRAKYQTIWYEVAHHWRDTEPASPPVMASGFFAPLDALTIQRTLNQDPQTRWVQTGPGLAGALILPAGGGGDGLLYVPEYAPPAAELLTAAHLPPEPSFRSAATPSFATYPLAGAHIAPTHAQATTFGGALTLVGFDVLVGQLLTYWRVESAAVPNDLKAFVHLLDAQGEIAAQHDGWDAVPATLQIGDIIIQRHLLDTAAVPPPLTFRLGLYQFHTNQRLLTNTGAEWLIVETSDKGLGTNDQ